MIQVVDIKRIDAFGKKMNESQNSADMITARLIERVLKEHYIIAKIKVM